MTDDLVKRLNMVDATMNPMTLVIVAREAASCIEQLQAALRFASGLISTMPPFDIDHPEEALEWITQESAALGEKKDAD
jgi:hypothetical protein